MNVKVIEWQKNYAAIFQPLPHPKIQAWEEFLKQNIRDLRAAEIDQAVADLCDQWNYRDERRHPGVKDIFWQIVRARKRRQRTPGAPQCALCYNGWTFSYHGPYAPGQPYEGKSAAVPCQCTTGQRWLEAYYSDSERLKYHIDTLSAQAVKDYPVVLARQEEEARALLANGKTFRDVFRQLSANILQEA